MRSNVRTSVAYNEKPPEFGFSVGVVVANRCANVTDASKIMGSTDENFSANEM